MNLQIIIILFCLQNICKACNSKLIGDSVETTTPPQDVITPPRLTPIVNTGSDLPEWIPSNGTFFIKEGDNFSVECRHRNKKVHMSFPQTEAISPSEIIRHTSYPIIIEEDNAIKFTRDSVVYGDSGWYGCAVDGIEINRHNHTHQTNVSWIYVFVENNNNWFIENFQDRLIYGNLNEVLVLPCRPTHPKLEVKLEYYLLKKPVELNERITWDEKIGLKFDPFLPEDHGKEVKCSISHKGSEQDNYFHLKLNQSLESIEH